MNMHTNMTQAMGSVSEILPRKSVGHLTFAFDGAVEFYEQDEQVFRATVHAGAFGPDGRRYGRWECSIGHYHRYKNVLCGKAGL